MKISKQDLIKYTLYVVKCARQEISLRDFIDIYNNYYLSYALDGHEADQSEIEEYNKYQKIIDMHKIIQIDIIFNTFIKGKNDQVYIDAGRITDDEALNKIIKVVGRFSKDIDMLISQE